MEIMKRIHIVGRKNHGKTTLVVELVEALTRSGVRVGTIKHSSHHHELDTPGKDSHRHRVAGACPAAIITPGLIGLYRPRSEDLDPWTFLESALADCDLVLVEGGIDAPGPKIEVWRGGLGGDCLASERDDIMAVVSDDAPTVPVPVWPRRDVKGLCQQVLDLLPRL